MKSLERTFYFVVEKIKRSIKKRIYICEWLPTYTKLDGISDLVAGITLGLTMMPQSMAYAALAGLPAQYGLYSAFAGSFLYVFFGTVKEVSIGPTSLMAILTQPISSRYPIEFVVLLAFLSGVLQFIMGCFKLGFLVDFISTPVTSGFTSATSVIIVIKQLKGLFGVKLDSEGVFEMAVELISKFTKVELADTILGVSSIIFLISVKQLTKIKVKSERIKKTLWLFSISRNAIAVLATSLIAFYLEGKLGKVPFKIYGNVTGGIPNFQLPKFSTKIGNETLTFFAMVERLNSRIVTVAVVGVLANIAIAKAFCNCFSAIGKSVDATQEMVTLGLCNVFGSFFQAMPSTGAFTRSAVSNTSGVRTPLAGIYSGTLIILALAFLTPYFYYVPTSTLSAILISAVVFMIDYEIIGKLWKINKIDLTITVATFLFSVVIGVEEGLILGVLLSLIPLLKLWTRPKILTQLSMMENGDRCILLRLQLGFTFPAVDYLMNEVKRILELEKDNNMSALIVDFQNVHKVDYTSLQALKNLQNTLKDSCINTRFVNVKDSVSKSLKDYGENLIDCLNDDNSDLKLFNISNVKNGNEKALLSNIF